MVPDNLVYIIADTGWFIEVTAVRTISEKFFIIHENYFNFQLRNDLLIPYILNNITLKTGYINKIY